jgi:hypothetical protein
MQTFAPVNRWRTGDWRCEWVFLSNLTELTMNQDYRRSFTVLPALSLDRTTSVPILLDRSRIIGILRSAPGQQTARANGLPLG